MNYSSHNHNIAAPDASDLKRKLVVGVLFFGAVFAASYVLRTGNMVLMSLFLALPFVLMLMGKPVLCIILSLILGPANIGVSGEITLAFAFRTLVVGTFFLGLMMGQKQWTGEKIAEKKPLIIFGVIVIVLMTVRGTGLRVLGGAMWGGNVYIALLASILFYMAVNGLRLEKKWFKWIIWGAFIAGVIGTFIDRAAWNAGADFRSDLHNERISWFATLVLSTLPLLFALKGKRMPFFAFIAVLGLLLGMISLTGYRSKLVGVIVMVGIYFIFKVPNKIAFIASMAVIGCLGWGMLVFTADSLPLSVQRAVSFVPGVEVDEATKANAAHSTEWRLEIWAECFKEAPKYLIVGRGSAFHLSETVEALGVNFGGTPWMAFLTRNYHSGPIELLIDYGLTGLIVVLWLTFLMIKRLWGYSVRLSPFDTFESRFVSWQCASLLWRWIAYHLVFGYINGLAAMITDTALTIIMAESLLAEYAKGESRETLDFDGDGGNGRLPVSSGL